MLKPLKVVMKIIDGNGNDIIGTPNLKRGEEYQIQIDFAETIVESYEGRMTHPYNTIFALYGGREGSRDKIILKGFFQEL